MPGSVYQCTMKPPVGHNKLYKIMYGFFIKDGAHGSTSDRFISQIKNLDKLLAIFELMSP